MKNIFLLFIAICLQIALIAQDAETRLKEKGIVLIPPPSPIANYINAVRVGNLLYLSGRGPWKADGTYITGKVAET
jgi:hypothetical protein